MPNVVCQLWLESERGWGERPDGYSLHLSEADRKAYCKEYWDNMPKSVPDEYSREDGKPFLLDLPEDALYENLMSSKNGIRCFGELPNGRSKTSNCNSA